MKKQEATVREVALDTLLKIEQQQAYSNLLLNDMIKSSKLAKVDVPLLTEIVYGTIQRQASLDFVLKHFSKKPLDKLQDWVLVLLRLSVYQLLHLDRVPDHAILNEAVTIANKRGHKGISGMVNGILRNVLRQGAPSFDSIKEPIERLAVKGSHPQWFVNRLVDQYGFDEAEKIVFANLEHPVSSIRVNEFKSDKDTIKEMLLEEGVEVEESPFMPHALRVTRGAVQHTDAFKEGYVSIQDEGSMLVALALDPKPGERILDACAAPGGKSMHIAELMQNEGQLISGDIHKHKVELLEAQQKRLGLSIIEGVAQDARKLDEASEPFDRVLVDAPCSGLGVLQRKPDIKWKKKESDISRLQEIQADILDAVWKTLKPGGRLIYSTCTIDKNENDHQITSFLSKHSDASRDTSLTAVLPKAYHSAIGEDGSMVQLLPGQFGTDGFFITSIKKAETIEEVAE
ncbi:16S rRNA (cytosine(967)-C(5))-methyltransferase RsmB [Paenalkalicoccus suaedae]|uniref:16S rRNA (cytosine(967)-C(5))-methyltransferase n=1 Tax=Paenalkalicoccus suaedae TaxID=2592382 RepID=A0A859FFU2_9BACI|nr:16S rRNA (cytosine(967)-C(5))-methyltransferase RsmB [Paenalkalicoccus suaedae]QKS71484.1 16S rRNA (cytosine(967)-C(5))-methyltransferase RsmB [Paenalkalicoccus suaedae]